MLNAGKDLSAVIHSLEVSEATFHRWRAQYGGMKSEEARRLKQLEEENQRRTQPAPRLNPPLHEIILQFLKDDQTAPPKQRHTAQRSSGNCIDIMKR